MKRLSLLLTGLIPTLSNAADGVLGTKAGGASTVAGSGGAPSMLSLVQMIFAVGIVLVLLKFALPKVVGKMGSKMVTKLGGGIQIEESANFAGGSLYVVTAHGKRLLLGVTGAQITCLSDLGSVNPPDPGPTFQEYVDRSDLRLAHEPPASVTTSWTPIPTDSQIPSETTITPEKDSVLSRIDRLLG